MDLTNIANKMLDYIDYDANLQGYLVINNIEYEISKFSIAFSRPLDYKGQPQQEVRGGLFNIILPELASKALYYWISSPYKKYNGDVIFRNETRGTRFRLSFTEAYCVDIQTEFISSLGTMTILTISAKELKIGKDGMDFIRWVEK